MSDTNVSSRNYVFSLAMLGALFFIFGLVSWVNSILVPYFKIACDLHSEVQGYLANFAFYIAYLIMTIPASLFMNKAGFKRSVEYGLWILAAGAMLFVPAAYVRSYNLFLIGLFTMGTALAILQTAANPFVTIIGPIESAARRISIMGVCNKLAGILAPIIFASIVIKPSDKTIIDQVTAGVLTGPAKNAALDQMILSVIPPYLILAIFLILFGILFYKSSIPDIDPNKKNKVESADVSERKSIFGYPYLILGAIAMFMHLGSQAVSVNTIMGYAQSMGLDILDAKIFPSFTLGCILFGYLIGIAIIPRYITQQKALVICTVTGLILSFLVVLTSGNLHIFGLDTDVSIWFLVLLGIPNSLIYAGIWPLAIKNLGKFTSLGSSILVMGLCGNAIVPMIYAWLADKASNLQVGYWVLLVCFGFMIFYAVKGYKIEHWS
ncbi:MAG: sugar MFS transporter [Bacteroidales bacterium]|nr:sugar MFS transporter [Bacteroidales bacterium]MDY6002489.1 sugar MFS transporter [Candidatus Cryptobacteroides sp.]